MSDSDKIRLDPATLRFMASRMRDELATTWDLLPSADPMTDAFVECITGMADESDELAAQEEARPPRLSDWVRACEVSKLGVPTDCRPTLADFKFGWRAHKLWMLIVAGRAGLTRGQPIGGAAIADFDSPTELTAALNALAEEVKP